MFIINKSVAKKVTRTHKRARFLPSPVNVLSTKKVPGPEQKTGADSLHIARFCDQGKKPRPFAARRTLTLNTDKPAKPDNITLME